MAKRKAVQPSGSKSERGSAVSTSSATNAKAGRGRPKGSVQVKLTKVQKTVSPPASSTPKQKRKSKTSKGATPTSSSPIAQTPKSEPAAAEKVKRTRKRKTVPIVEAPSRPRRVQNSTNISKSHKPVIQEPMDVVDSNHSEGKDNGGWFRSCSIM